MILSCNVSADADYNEIAVQFTQPEFFNKADTSYGVTYIIYFNDKEVQRFDSQDQNFALGGKYKAVLNIVFIVRTPKLVLDSTTISYFPCADKYTRCIHTVPYTLILLRYSSSTSSAQFSSTTF